jgi:hypothetical protein
MIRYLGSKPVLLHTIMAIVVGGLCYRQFCSNRCKNGVLLPSGRVEEMLDAEYNPCTMPIRGLSG